MPKRAYVLSNVDAQINRNSITICQPVDSNPYTWTIFGFDPHEGDWVEVRCNSVGIRTLKDPFGNILTFLDGNGASAVQASAVLIGGTWYLSSASQV